MTTEAVNYMAWIDIVAFIGAGAILALYAGASVLFENWINKRKSKK